MYVAQVQAQNKHSRGLILGAVFAYTSMLKRILTTRGLPKGSLGWTGKSSRAQNETQDSPSMRITDSWAKVFL
jgi:hypothetical protein